MTPTTTANPVRRRYRDDVKPLPTYAAELAPEPLREADAAHREAVERVHRLRREARAAGEAVERVEREDREAAARAVDRGRKPPKAKRAAAVEHHETARRAVEGAEELALKTERAFRGAYNRHREAFAAEVEAATDEVTDPGLIDTLERMLIRRRQLALIARELDHRIAGGQSFKVAEPNPAHPLGREAGKLIAGIRELLGE